MALQSHKELRVWQKSRILVKNIYQLCTLLPKDEMYGISSQLKRTAISVPSNIAGGYARNNRKQYIQFLGISSGSDAELETQLILVSDIFQARDRGIDHTRKYHSENAVISYQTSPS